MIWHPTSGLFVSDCDRYQIVPISETMYHCYKRVSDNRFKYCGHGKTLEEAKAVIENSAIENGQPRV